MDIFISSYGYSHWDSTTYLKENPVFDQPLGNIIDDILNGNVHSHEILYIPVFYLVYLIELQLGFSPQVMHATGILIHLLNIVLLTICLTKLKTPFWCNAIAVSAFSIHPLQVETVVWLMGKKDLIATAWLLLAICSFTSSIKFNKAFTLLFYLLACFTKPSVITMFPIFALIDYFCLKKKEYALHSLLLGISVFCYFLNVTTGETWESIPFHWGMLPFWVWHWIEKVLCLSPVSPLYFWDDMKGWRIYAGLVAIFTIVPACAFIVVKRKPQMILVLAWILLYSVPAVALFLKLNRFFYTADRYMYTCLPFIVLLALLFLRNCFERYQKIICIFALIWLIFSGYNAKKVVAVWRSPLTFWSYVIKQSPNTYIPNLKYALAMRVMGNKELAIQYFERAYQLAPKREEVTTPYIDYLVKVEEYQRALDIIEQILAIEPNYPHYVKIKREILFKIEQQKQ